MIAAYSENNAIEQVQLTYPDYYVHCFGESMEAFDIAVYNSYEDFEADENEGDNRRMINRVQIPKTNV